MTALVQRQPDWSTAVQLELSVGTESRRRLVDVIGDLSDFEGGKPVAQPEPVSDSDVKRHEARLRKVAALRIARIAIPREKRAHWSPAQHTDHQTSMADARIALCLAQGVALEDIDPTSGYSLSRASYERVRESWQYTVKMHGFGEYHRRELEKVMAYWSQHRPEFTEGDDWLRGLTDNCESAEAVA